jgi:hypothetical protein
MEPDAWYALLNGKVFFWPTEQRLHTHQIARGNRDREHCVLIVDTAALLAAVGERVTLCPINSGAALRKAAARGPQTFQRISDYPYEARKKARGAAGAIAEVAVDYALADVQKLVLSVAAMRNGAVLHGIEIDERRTHMAARERRT